MKKILFLIIVFVVYFNNLVYAKKIIYPQTLDIVNDPEIVVSDIYNLIETGLSKNTYNTYESYSNQDDIKQKVNNNTLLQRIGEDILLELEGASHLNVNAQLAELSKYYYSTSKKTVLAIGVFKVSVPENYSSSVSFYKSKLKYNNSTYAVNLTTNKNLKDLYIPFLFITSEDVKKSEGLLLDNDSTLFKTLDEYHNSNLYRLISNVTNENPGDFVQITNDPTSSDLSSWALSSKYYIDRYVPVDMLNNYKSNITRKEFAKLAVSVYVKILEEQITKLSDQKPTDFDQQLNQKFEDTYYKTNRRFEQNVFTDTNDYYVNLAYAFGMVNGFSGYYYPDNNISREEAAVLVASIVKLVDILPNSNPKSFKDVDTSSFAFESIGKLSSITTVDGNAIMQGITEDLFDPKGWYTREQAYVTFVKLVRSYYKS